MRVVRKGVFETNSSSVHSLTIVPNDEKYEKFIDGEMFLSENEDKFLTKEEVISIIINNKWCKITREEFENMSDREFEQEAADYEYYSLDKYNSMCDCYEQFLDKFTTPSGDKMIAFGYSGYD